MILRKRQYPEFEIQCAVARQLEARRILFTASPAQAKLPDMTRIRLWQSGVKSGVPDLLIFEPRNGKVGLAIELKSAQGTPTDDQMIWRDSLISKGWAAYICPKLKTNNECFQWAMKIIDEYFIDNSKK